jgi:ribonucleoside-diphosphate reductase alpha chain
VPDAIAQALIQHERERAGIQEELPIIQPAGRPAVPQVSLEFEGYNPGETFIGSCPDCAAELHFMEGCMKCLACGYSECS